MRCLWPHQALPATTTAAATTQPGHRSALLRALCPSSQHKLHHVGRHDTQRHVGVRPAVLLSADPLHAGRPTSRFSTPLHHNPSSHMPLHTPQVLKAAALLLAWCNTGQAHVRLVPLSSTQGVGLAPGLPGFSWPGRHASVSTTSRQLLSGSRKKMAGRPLIDLV